ncbi:MAG TPA: lycopene cyclase domain-containing protein [Myxococcaceae bacterium]|nr:lycopene cyclase domain-containing protein [Myxococcaceae bacterium]
MNGPTAYLVHLLAWSLPVLMMQLALVGWRYREHTTAVLRAVLPPALGVTAWLVAGDHLAIRAGIWQFGEGKHLGIHLGAVPIEEALFFLVTNLLVVLGLALFWPRTAEAAGTRGGPAGVTP